jgi:hypothetical protein
VNLPAQLVARAAGLDAYNTDGPLSTAYLRNDGVLIKVERDWAMANRELKLNSSTVGPTERAFRAALPAKIPHYSAHFLPGNAELGGRELSVDPLGLSMGRGTI